MIQKKLKLKDFLLSLENIDRACSSVIENSYPIFLPFKRLYNTHIQKKFDENNRRLIIEDTPKKTIEIHGRLLGQQHKDILEVLLSEQLIYDTDYKRFRVETTSYKLLKRLKKGTRNKQWLIQKLEEIAECRVKVSIKNDKNQTIEYSFNFISSLGDIDQKQIIVNFTPEYTYFIAKNELLDYKNYIDDIISLKDDFIKAIVRYMLINNGANSQIRIDKLIKKLKFDNLVSNYDLQQNLRKLKTKDIQMLLKEKFGITLTNNEETLTFKKLDRKKHYFIKPNIKKS